MLHMCVCMHSCFVKNHLIRILEDGPLISELVVTLRHCRWLEQIKDYDVGINYHPGKANDVLNRKKHCNAWQRGNCYQNCAESLRAQLSVPE
jgi:hypothetical protein